jgi:hypothetical protein
MAKKKVARKKATKKTTTARKPELDSADGVRVGEQPVPGMRLRCICRGHQAAIGRIAWSPCGRFIASPNTDKSTRVLRIPIGKMSRSSRSAGW